MENDSIFMSLDHDMVRRLKHASTARGGWACWSPRRSATSRRSAPTFSRSRPAWRRAAFVRRAHRAGQDVYVWTVNDPAWMLDAMSHGVDGLITDRPDLARAGGRAARRDERRAARAGGAAGPRRRAHRAAGGRGGRAAVMVGQPAEERMMQLHSAHRRAASAAVRALAAVVVMSLAGPADAQHARLVARSVLPAATYRAGSPPSGAFFSAAERATAAANGVRGPADGPYLAAQPVQGFSSMVPADAGTWWALADNGYAWRGEFGRLPARLLPARPPLGRSRRARGSLETVVLRDPDRRHPVDDRLRPEDGARRCPTSPSTCCPPRRRRAAATRRPAILTGFDLDPESFVRAPDGTLLGERGVRSVPGSRRGRRPGAGAAGPDPGVRSPQNPFLKISDRARAERPTLAASRGFEGLAISPDGSTLYALLEGAVTGDDPRDLRIYVYDVARRAFADRVLHGCAWRCRARR